MISRWLTGGHWTMSECFPVTFLSSTEREALSVNIHCSQTHVCLLSSSLTQPLLFHIKDFWIVEIYSFTFYNCARHKEK